MITWEDIQAANAEMKLTDIKGKAYAEVPQRIKAFRSCVPDGFITTHIESLADGICVMTATVGYYDEDRMVVLATGTAYEREGSTFINKTSYIENCETSAVGRALGIAGFGIDTSVASAEEVMNAMLNDPKAITSALTERCKADGIDIRKLCDLYKVKTLGALTASMRKNIDEHWDEIKEAAHE